MSKAAICIIQNGTPLSVFYVLSAYDNHFPPKKKLFGHVNIWPHADNHLVWNVSKFYSTAGIM
jgi:hypothetical protein